MSVLEMKNEISSFRLNFLTKFGCSNVFCQRASVNSLGFGWQLKCQFCGSSLQHGSHSETCNPMPELLDLINGIMSSVSGMDLGASERIPTKGPEWGDIRKELLLY